MAEDTEPFEMLNKNAGRAVKQAEEVVEKTINQMRGALDNYFNFMQKAFSFYPVGGTELAEKIACPKLMRCPCGSQLTKKFSPLGAGVASPGLYVRSGLSFRCRVLPPRPPNICS